MSAMLRPVFKHIMVHANLTLAVVLMQMAVRADFLRDWGVCSLYLHLAVHVAPSQRGRD